MRKPSVTTFFAINIACFYWLPEYSYIHGCYTDVILKLLCVSVRNDDKWFFLWSRKSWSSFRSDGFNCLDFFWWDLLHFVEILMSNRFAIFSNQSLKIERTRENFMEIFTSFWINFRISARLKKYFINIYEMNFNFSLN